MSGVLNIENVNKSSAEKGLKKQYSRSSVKIFRAFTGYLSGMKRLICLL